MKGYAPTKIKRMKSYPTYQLHTFVMSDKLSADDIFKVCILETFEWIRARLDNFECLPPQMLTIKPENFSELTEDMLGSFSFDAGFNIDVVYIAKKGIWSFNITESDMGANPGTANERKPVLGRSFSTDISFRKLGDCVEAGIRTVCSEPYDTDEACEVFRPSLVKMLALKDLVYLKYHCKLDGKAVNISTQTETTALIRMIQDRACDIPVIIVAEPPFCETKSEAKKEEKKFSGNDIASLSIGTVSGLGLNSFPAKKTLDMSISKPDFEVKNEWKEYKDKKEKIEKNEKKAKIGKKPALPASPEKREETIDFKRLAESLVGFAVVCFVSENCLKILKNKLDFDISCGETVAVDHGIIVDRYAFERGEDNLKKLYSKIKRASIMRPKRNNVSYGEILFHTDARLYEIKSKKSESLTLEEKADLISQENRELKQKISEYEQRDADINAVSEALRNARKKISSLESENEQLSACLSEMTEKFELINKAYMQTADRIAFYREKILIASSYPNDKDEICSWAEEKFSDTVMIAPRAKAELRKYSGAMDTAMLCDGILYIHAYALWRSGKISDEILALYGEERSWEAEGCGKEAMRVYKDDYTVTLADKKYLMNLHIKYGVKAQQLIRIYFCYDDETQKAVIGYMPGHLATINKNT